MSNFVHRPVMAAEALAALMPGAGGKYADGTIGGGGHAEAILAASSPTGWLYGCDRDGAAIEAARGRLGARFAGRFEIRRGNFADMAEWVPLDSCDGVLLDLGVSSPQLDSPGRGFSFQQDGPLDMRMDERQELTAAEVVNSAEAEKLAAIFWEYGGERQSRRLARMIVRSRERQRIETTAQLAELIESALGGGGGKTHPATKAFQALRIAVNDETGSLKRGLETGLRILRPGGRLAVITFHSLETRVFKEFERATTRDYTFEGGVDAPELRRPRAPVMKKAGRWLVTENEAKENPRSRSAQLRVLEKI
ncbi:MAG: 16S rRNA (cytosine(1402)-N(4))-methyltransferase RsmH [Verrucomicrobia bacterium]|nr:16S rRNA (cytosine(1402)-N(4))-methyltransferase RsmH [Verrucomicrobiota bacterium]MDE3099370.1 16S rRNA (cytosine(1402)-N(4))-methyltransferase RsmH [Verrucomicrobiota bacterium]